MCRFKVHFARYTFSTDRVNVSKIPISLGSDTTPEAHGNRVTLNFKDHASNLDKNPSAMLTDGRTH
jgi:hypothetical protein